MSIISHETFASLYADPAKIPFGPGPVADQGVAITALNYYSFRGSNRPKSARALLVEVENIFQVPRLPGVLCMFQKQTSSETG